MHGSGVLISKERMVICQSSFCSQLFAAGPISELVLCNTEDSGVLATNLSHRRHPDNTSKNQSSSAALKALLGCLTCIEAFSWG